MKVGIGFDVHKLVENRDLVLAGLKIDFEKGLAGHSDADVLTHAIMDAIIGAIGLGDIGTLFPDDDMKYKDIESLKLLAELKIVLNDKKFKIMNIDSIITAEKPKLNKYIDIMEKNIADCLEIDKNIVNIKATTQEKLGFVGREEGIAAYAVVMIKNIE